MDHEMWLKRFANLWLACEKEQEIVHSVEAVEERIGRLIKEELKAGIPKDSIRDQEEWLKKFADLWLACDKNYPSPKEIQSYPEPESQKIESEIPKNSIGYFSSIEKTNVQSSRRHHSSEIMAALEKGKIVVGDGFLNPSKREENTRNDEEGLPNLKETNLRPDDILVVEIDPEIAIKLWTATKGIVS